MKELIFTQEEIDSGYYIDTDSDMICGHCGEHASPTYEIIVHDDGNSDLGKSEGSDCCGARERYEGDYDAYGE